MLRVVEESSAPRDSPQGGAFTRHFSCVRSYRVNEVCSKIWPGQASRKHAPATLIRLYNVRVNPTVPTRMYRSQGPLRGEKWLQKNFRSLRL